MTIAVVVTTLATFLLTVGARSPYTHGNLQARFDPGYTRTQQTLVGPPEPYAGFRREIESPATTDAAMRGSALFVKHGCASCHGMEGRGGVVGPPIIGSDAADLRAKTSKGPGGMPAYARGEPSDGELVAIAAYLTSLAR